MDKNNNEHSAQLSMPVVPPYPIQVNQFVKMDFGSNADLTGKLRPTARSGHRAIADDNNMWLIGGYNPDQTNVHGENDSFPLFREFWNYNVSTNQWKLLPNTENMPCELASHSAIQLGQCMLVFGGTGVPFGERSSNHLTACRLDNGQWSAVVSTGAKPEKIYGQAMVIHGCHLYIYGGTTGYVYNTDLHRLDLQRFEWEKLSPNNRHNELPPQRYRHEIVCYQDQIYVLGGGTSHVVYPLFNVYVYSIRDNTWRRADTKPDPVTKWYPCPRRCHSCVQLGARAYICGGYDGKAILGDLWQLDLAALQWRKLSDMPEPVYFHSAAVTTEGCMLVFGGVSCIRSTRRTDSCYRVWLRIPSLQTLCWTRLLSSRPSLLAKSRHELLRMGIARPFVNKLPCADGA